jgi:acyl-CoA thioesterase-2
MPAAPDPDTLPTLQERLEDAGIGGVDYWSRPRPIDVRYVGDPPWLARQTGRRVSHQQVWLRTAGRLPDDPLLHVCVVAYASDMTLLDSVLMAHGLAWHTGGNVQGASLDHAMWFHRPFRADEWLLYDQESPVANGARGLATGRMWTRDGQHVVSVVQEGLLRVIEPLDEPGSSPHR